jgi:hypothetical protein
VGGVLRILVLAIVVLLVLGVVTRTITRIIAASKPAPNPQTKQQVDGVIAQAEEIKRRQAEEYARTGGVTIDKGEQDRVVQGLESAASSATGDEAAALKASAEVTRRLSAQSVAYANAVQTLTDAGGMDIATLDTRPKIEERLALVEKLTQSNDALDRSVRTLGDDYLALLQKHAMSPAKQAATRDAFLREAKHPSLIEMRQIQRDLCGAMHDYLAILNEQHGNWILHTAGVVFENDDAGRRFQRAADAIQRAVQAESDWMQRNRGVSAPAELLKGGK